MRKINGDDIARNELKKYWFGYVDDCDDLSFIVDCIEIDDSIFSTNEEGNMYVRFPKRGVENYEKEWYMINAFPRNQAITVYDFIENYYNLDTKPLGAFTFYIVD